MKVISKILATGLKKKEKNEEDKLEDILGLSIVSYLGSGLKKKKKEKMRKIN